MDPTQTLLDALMALIDDDAEEARVHLTALADWLDRDGFPPDVPEVLHRATVYMNHRASTK